ncbi:MAG: hypothetical protein ACOZAO_00655 [Patescibacteria group bacterium]
MAISKVVTVICITVMVTFAVFNLYFGVIHNSHVIYDEANTLNIISQSYKDIFTLLSKEQNIPGYYLLIGTVFKAFKSVTIIKLINYVIWIASIVAIFKLLKTYMSNNMALIFVTGYTLIPGISFYSYFIRMYGLIVLLVILLLLFYKQLLDTGESKYLIRFFVCLALLATLHAQFVFVWVIFFFSFIINFYKSRNFKLILIAFLAVFVLFLIPFAFKSDLIDIYVQNGIAYVKEQKAPYYTFVHLLFFKYDNPLSVVLGFTVLITFIVFCRKHYSKTEFPYLLAIVFTVLIPIHKSFNQTTMHYIFLSPLIYVIVARALASVKTRVNILFFIIAFIWINSFVFSWRLILYKDYILINALCKEISSSTNTIYLTRFYSYEAFAHCSRENSTNKAFIIANNNYYDTSSLSKAEVLHIQAELGGDFYNDSADVLTVYQNLRQLEPTKQIYYLPVYDILNFNRNEKVLSTLEEKELNPVVPIFVLP